MNKLFCVVCKVEFDIKDLNKIIPSKEGSDKPDIYYCRKCFQKVFNVVMANAVRRASQ